MSQELPPMPTPRGRRPPPPKVPPVRVGDVRFEQSPLPFDQADGGQRHGYLAAYQADTNELLWRVRVYEIEYEPHLERDVQDVFFAAMSVSPDGHQIFIDNTHGLHFAVDIDGDHAVHARP